MQRIDSEEELGCPICKKRAATTQYTYRSSKRVVTTCAPCVERLQLEEDYLDDSVHIAELIHVEQFDAALAHIEQFYQANRYRDQEAWLLGITLSNRASILWEAERYAESLEACNERAKLGFDHAWDWWAHGSATADALTGLERHQEALAVYEEALSHQDSRIFGDIAYYLPKLVELAENAGQPVNEKWRALAEAVAADYEIEMPVRESLGEALIALAELTRKIPPRRAREWKETNG